MQEILTAQKIPNLAGLGNVVPEGYKYYKKNFTPGKFVSFNLGYSLKLKNNKGDIL